MQFTKLTRNSDIKKKKLLVNIYIHTQHILMVNKKDDNTAYMVNTNWEILLKQQDCNTQQFAH